MAVPETAMHKDDCTVAWQRDVRCARQISPVESVAESGCVQCFADYHFLPGVL